MKFLLIDENFLLTEMSLVDSEKQKLVNLTVYLLLNHFGEGLYQQEKL